MRTGLIFICMLSLTACLRKSTHVSYIPLQEVILADTGYDAVTYLPYEEDPVFPIYYLGPLKDTISIGRYYDRRRNKPDLPYPDVAINQYSSENLSIYVDTSFSATITADYYNDNGIIQPDSTRHFNASVIILRNMTDTAMYMGMTYSLYYMHREIKNSQGKWVRTCNKLRGEMWCASGQPDIFLKPGEVMISKIAHYGGPHTVACRLAFGRLMDGTQVYSNVFTACIDNELLKLVEEN